MRVLLRRVINAKVEVENAIIGEISTGLLVLVGAVRDDNEEITAKLASKIANIRVFRDENGRMNRSILDIKGEILAVSQFTLAADTTRGNRPGFSGAADPEMAKHLYEYFCSRLVDKGLVLETGRFGADMKVSLVNDGPVTIWLDSET